MVLIRRVRDKPRRCIEGFDALAKDHDLKKVATFARMLKKHSLGILTAWKRRISTGPLEGVNTRARLIKRLQEL